MTHSSAAVKSQPWGNIDTSVATPVHSDESQFETHSYTNGNQAVNFQQHVGIPQ